MWSETRSKTFWLPNHAETFVVFMLDCCPAKGAGTAFGDGVA
jgi:hypothetical protein